MNQYTLVQHSAAGYNNDPGFLRGLESRMIETEHDLRNVQKSGGLLFNTYNEAEDAALEIMYPASYFGIIPKAPGGFSPLKVDGLKIYMPPKEPLDGQ